MYKTRFRIQQMDCPSEEQMIRMKLQAFPQIKGLDFDIPHRQLDVFHEGPPDAIERALDQLNLQSRLVDTIGVVAETRPPEEGQRMEKRLLWAVLWINFAFFLIESIIGWLAHSMGLTADSLDMLADAIVYGMALLAVGGSAIRKKNIARWAGYFQMLLAVMGAGEVVRRFAGWGAMPDYQSMVFVSLLALAANAICLYLLQKSKSKEAHIQASMIFTSNDVLINAGVVSAGLLVQWTQSNLPDLLIGAVVFVVVARGAYRILQLANH